MPSEYIGFRRGLLELARLSARSWKDEDHGLWTLRLIVVNDDRLDRILPNDGPERVTFPPEERGGANLALLLPPIDDEPRLRCWITLKWDYTEGKRSGRGGLRLFMVRLEETVKWAVIRLDDREAGEGWCFAHAQNSDLLTPYRASKETLVSATLPRIPLACVVADSQTLLVTLLLGLYGLGSIVRRVTGEMIGGAGGHLLQELEQVARDDER